METYTLKTGRLSASFNEKGAELCKVTGADGTEYLWNADPAYWARFSPVLFPVVGNFNGKAFSYKGESYPMGQHGFARDAVFTMAAQTENTITFRFASDEETRKKYPMDFELLITYTVKENQITVAWEVTANGTEPLHFSIGAHPAFNCPLGGEGKQTDYTINLFTDDKEVKCGVIGEGGTLSDVVAAYPLENGHLHVTETLFDKDALIVEGNQIRKLALCRPDGSAYVTMTFDAPLFGIWSPTGKNAPFICLEPWYGRTDRYTFHGDVSEREYGHTLQPGEKFNAEYTMIFE